MADDLNASPIADGGDADDDSSALRLHERQATRQALLGSLLHSASRQVNATAQQTLAAASVERAAVAAELLPAAGAVLQVHEEVNAAAARAAVALAAQELERVGALEREARRRAAAGGGGAGVARVVGAEQPVQRGVAARELDRAFAEFTRHESHEADACDLELFLEVSREEAEEMIFLAALSEKGETGRRTIDSAEFQQLVVAWS